MGNLQVDYAMLKKFRDNIKELDGAQKERFYDAAAKELAARLLSSVKKRTPVGQYPTGSGKTGGTLRRSWFVGSVAKKGDAYTVEVKNPMQYASYVEHGHRQEPGRYVPALGKRLKKGWVKGCFMLKISSQELKKDYQRIVSNRLDRFIKDTLDA